MTRQRNSERSAGTRAALLQAGQELFGERGFASVGTGELVAQAGVTRGALYHHFHDKLALFQAVYEDVQRDLAARLPAAGRHAGSPLERLDAAIETSLEACLDPAFCRIALLDAPAQLGWADLRRPDERYALGFFRSTIAEAMDAGQLPRGPVDVLAHVVLGAVAECGMLIARSPDREAARARVGEGLHHLLAALAIRE